jgi:uncharacterized NAD(P)/FAD-binding protein YdhS
LTPVPRTIVIVGAGFSGTVVAINLLRLDYTAPVRIVLIERAEKMARGAAYAEKLYPYLLNVPAGRMSLNSSDPMEFLKFVQQRLPDATAEDFLPRPLYGQYLALSLLDAEADAPDHVDFQRIHGEVIGVDRLDPTTSLWQIELSDGSSFVADEVVLALGNPPPGQVPGTESLVGSPAYVADPWATPPEFQRGETALVLGTGLSMADTVLAGSDTAPADTVFHVLSRRGLVPPSQSAFRHAGCDEDATPLLRAASRSARHLMRAVRNLTDDVQARGGDWREAITFVRTLAPAIWQRLEHRERKRFLRHARPYWEIHRHRLPSVTVAKLNALRSNNKLYIHAGRIVKFELADDKVLVTWRPRREEHCQTLVVDRVINCTGADYNVKQSGDPLFQSLLEQGIASPDALRLGLRTGTNGALIDVQDNVVPNIYYIGPMLRADLWECTAAQELRVHAERLAHHLASAASDPVSSTNRGALTPRLHSTV